MKNDCNEKVKRGSCRFGKHTNIAFNYQNEKFKLIKFNQTNILAVFEDGLKLKDVVLPEEFIRINFKNKAFFMDVE